MKEKGSKEILAVGSARYYRRRMEQKLRDRGEMRPREGKQGTAKAEEKAFI